MRKKNALIIGKRIQEIRKREHMTQLQLAEQADLSSSYISYIENGKKTASINAILCITNALNITVDDILYGSQNNYNCEYQSDWDVLTDDCTLLEKKIMFKTAQTVKEVLREHATLLKKELQDNI